MAVHYLNSEQQSLTEVLRELLESAEAGELEAISFAGYLQRDGKQVVWTGHSLPEMVDYWTLLGALDMEKSRIREHLHEQDAEEDSDDG